MKESANPNYKAWVEELVRTCLPLQLQKKLLSLEPLTKEEVSRFMSVIQLAGEVRRMGDHGEAMARLAGIEAEVKRQGVLTRREFRRLGDEPERSDRRSAAQRACIDRAVRLYVLLHDINCAKAASFLSCCNRYWPQAQPHFRDIDQYKNFTVYDYNNFYDLAALTEMIKRGEIEP